MWWMRPFFAIKQETAAFWAERVLVAKAELKLESFLMRHRCKTRIPFPHHSSTKDTSSSVLGWEFQFLVPISGTPFGSGILIPFLIPKIPVGFFFEILMSGKSENWNSDLRYSEFR
jgi:hypothetical protein